MTIAREAIIHHDVEWFQLTTVVRWTREKRAREKRQSETEGKEAVGNPRHEWKREWKANRPTEYWRAVFINDQFIVSKWLSYLQTSYFRVVSGS